MLLPLIRGQDGNGLGRIPNESHEHESGDHELSLCQVLVEERTGLGFAHAVEIRHVDQLVVEAEAAVGANERRFRQHVTQVAKAFVSGKRTKLGMYKV